MSRRFIAGATCPDCKQVDTIYVIAEPEVIIQRCTRCDFTAGLSRTDGVAAPAPARTVTPDALHHAPQPVRIIDPGASREN